MKKSSPLLLLLPLLLLRVPASSCQGDSRQQQEVIWKELPQKYSSSAYLKNSQCSPAGGATARQSKSELKILRSKKREREPVFPKLLQ
ncbi:Desmocollin-2 [Manis pentadactyla]|nr:Desmocollin-2 [Manis pentadactyla]